MSSFPRSLLSKEEKPCNDVVERILSMICPATMQGIESALGTKTSFEKLLIDVQNEAIQLLGTSDLFEKLEHLLYKADDMIDCSLPSQRSCTSRRLKKIARKIKEIESELAEKRAYEFRSSFFNKDNPRNPRIEHVALDYFIGRDTDRSAILSLLINEHEESGVYAVTILGDGGLGKTELAKVVFEDKKIQECFKSRLWISGFDSLDLDSQTKSLLMPQNDDEKLQVLVVVDGVFGVDSSKFEALLDLLRSRGARGSRAVVTTRNEDVAKAFSTEKTTYRLKPLDDEASLALFKVFGGKNNDAEEIVRRCGGNVMSLNIIGSLMSLKRAGVKKQSFSKKELLKMPQERVDAITTVKTGYRRLPMHLKPCFALCGLFPKKRVIQVRKLVHLWTSQGFISSSIKQRPEDVGYEYFADLLKRFFFEGVEHDELSGHVSKCIIPDIFHDLARQVAGIECAAMRMEQEEDETVVHVKTRHTSFDFHLDSPWQISDLLFQAKKVRTITLPSQLNWQIEGRSGTSICDTIVSNFNRLRSLDLQNSGLKTVSESIGKLSHLRYLDLSQNTDVRSLPNSICSLSSLQTLKLNFCGRLEELPREISKLTSLRDLELDSCYSLTHMPRGIGSLTSLQTLSEFVLNNNDAKRSASDQIAELKKLNELRGELRIKNLSLDTEAREAELDQKANLRSLVLIWDMKSSGERTDSMRTEELNPHPNLREVSFFGFCAAEFPTWLPLQVNLTKLTLWKCLKCKSLPTKLSFLPRLEALAIEDMPDLEQVIKEDSTDSPFFPSLTELRLIDLPRLHSWRLDNSIGFQSLTKLIIEDCPKLTSMPVSKELRHLVLKNTLFSPLSSVSVSNLCKLETLRIVCSPIGKCWPSDQMKSLRSLTLDHLPYVKRLPSGISELVGLKELNIWRCNNLRDISDCVEKLKSLERLSMKLCLNLELSLSVVSLLASRAELEIQDCPRIKNVINSNTS